MQIRKRIFALYIVYIYVYIRNMNIMYHIRTTVLRITQSEMALIAGTQQATVSRWETNDTDKLLIPNREQLFAIRNEAVKRGLDWSDSWFFDAPEKEAV